jgi:uncharacterized protein
MMWRAQRIKVPVYLVVMMMLLSFIIGLVVLWFCVKKIHGRDPRTLIHPLGNINWSRIFKSVGLWLTCSALVEFVTYLIHPAYYQFSLVWSNFIPSIFVGLLLIPLQTSFEELFFRGYLLQGIGSWNFWAGVLFSSLLFGLVHGANDEIKEVGAIALVYYVGVGLFFALLAVLDRNLEQPLGIHAANNIYAFLLVGYPSSSLPTASIITTTTINFPLMIGQWLIVVVMYLILARKVLDFKPKLNDWQDA